MTFRSARQSQNIFYTVRLPSPNKFGGASTSAIFARIVRATPVWHRGVTSHWPQVAVQRTRPLHPGIERLRLACRGFTTQSASKDHSS
jgi:hypothetical protein